jgi:hypothetical protein
MAEMNSIRINPNKTWMDRDIIYPCDDNPAPDKYADKAATEALTKQNARAAQPEYVPGAVAMVSNAGIHGKRKTLKCKITYIILTKEV